MSVDLVCNVQARRSSSDAHNAHGTRIAQIMLFDTRWQSCAIVVRCVFQDACHVYDHNKFSAAVMSETNDMARRDELLSLLHGSLEYGIGNSDAPTLLLSPVYAHNIFVERAS